MKKKISALAISAAVGFVAGACVIPDKGICILEKGYQWCLSTQGALAYGEDLVEFNVLVKGCKCLTPGENEIMETKGLLDPNTSNDDAVSEYEALRDLIGAETAYQCAKRVEDYELLDDNCNEIIDAKLADENDAQPYFAKRCDQIAQKNVPCGEIDVGTTGIFSTEGSDGGTPTSTGEASTTDTSSGTPTTGEEPTSGDPTEGGMNSGDPYYSQINWGTVNTPSFDPLDCDVDQTCCTNFDAAICEFVAPEAERLGRRADYHVEASVAVTLTAGACTGSSPETGTFSGGVDFSPSTCAQDKCPFYLASFEANLDNPLEVILPIATENGIACLDKEITSASIELIRAKIGARSSLSDRVAFAPGSLSMRVRYELADASAVPIPSVTDVADGQHQVIVQNDSTVFAEVLEDGTVQSETAQFSSPNAGLTLSFSFTSTVTGSPPTAVIVNPGTNLECDGPDGIILDLTSASSDVNNDILNEVWRVDSVRSTSNDVSLTIGSHLLNLSTYDSRGAVSRADLAVEVVDTTDPVISTGSSSLTRYVCTRAGGTIEVPVPLTSDTCATSSLGVEGRIVEYYGASLTPQIEVVDGRVDLAAGTYTVEWMVEDESGNIKFEEQTLIVEIEESSEGCCRTCAQVIEGSEFSDEIEISGAQQSIAFGLEDDDLLAVESGCGVLVGGPGADMISDEAGTNTLVGGDGDDELIRSGAEMATLFGGGGDDTITGSDAAERIFGESGDDTIFAGGGADWISPGGGEDEIDAGPGDDVVVFFDACEYIDGGLLMGGSGTDTLRLPSSFADLQTAGVVVDSFEIVIEGAVDQWYRADCL